MRAKMVYRVFVVILVSLMAAAVLPAGPALGQTMTPGTPRLVDPPDGEAVSITPGLDWDDVSGATSYYVEVYSDSACNNVHRPSPVLDSSEWTVAPDLLPGTQYWWRVKAKYPDDLYGSWSSNRSFITSNNQPGRPSNKSPEDHAIGVNLTPTLQSSDFFDLDGGDELAASLWQITDVSRNYSDPIFDSQGDAANLTQRTIPSQYLTYNTTYYWRVKHEDSQHERSHWSEETQFRTAAAADYPNLTVSEPEIDGLSVSVNGSVFRGTPGTNITRIHWDWGDGGPEDHSFPASHTYDGPGEYEITITAYQSNYLCSVETKQILLEAPPWSRFLLPGVIVLAGIVLTGVIWGNTTLRMKRNLRKWEEEGYDLSDWR